MIPLHFSTEVAEARRVGAPIVALESTIITHGMPAPENVETALKVEAVVRESGAVPATIAVIRGQVHVGMSEQQLNFLAEQKQVYKLSRADLPVAIAAGRTGSTTVAATMIAAHLAGIHIFATGGIGGVHRGAENTFDISADLRELALTPVTVVAAGAKAILDLPKTLEVLETYGVPVISVGQDAFPAFWSRDSGLKAPLRFDNPLAIARTHRMRGRMGLAGGQLIANPIPKEAEIPLEEMKVVVQTALDDAESQEIVGKQVTPFLLDRIYNLTAGRSLSANIELVLNNARLGASIARELSKIG